MVPARPPKCKTRVFLHLGRQKRWFPVQEGGAFAPEEAKTAAPGAERGCFCTRGGRNGGPKCRKGVCLHPGA